MVSCEEDTIKGISKDIRRFGLSGFKKGLWKKTLKTGVSVVSHWDTQKDKDVLWRLQEVTTAEDMTAKDLYLFYLT